MGAVVGGIFIAIKSVGKIFSNGHRQICFAGLTSASQKNMLSSAASGYQIFKYDERFSIRINNSHLKFSET